MPCVNPWGLKIWWFSPLLKHLQSFSFTLPFTGHQLLHPCLHWCFVVSVEYCDKKLFLGLEFRFLIFSADWQSVSQLSPVWGVLLLSCGEMTTTLEQRGYEVICENMILEPALTFPSFPHKTEWQMMSWVNELKIRYKSGIRLWKLVFHA